MKLSAIKFLLLISNAWDRDGHGKCLKPQTLTTITKASVPSKFKKAFLGYEARLGNLLQVRPPTCNDVSRLRNNFESFCYFVNTVSMCQQNRFLLLQPPWNTQSFQHKILHSQDFPHLHRVTQQQNKNLQTDVIEGDVPEEWAGIVQRNVKNTILPHTLPVHRASEDFIHHLVNIKKNN